MAASRVSIRMLCHVADLPHSPFGPWAYRGKLIASPPLRSAQPALSALVTLSLVHYDVLTGI